jgi:hypothetical protein
MRVDFWLALKATKVSNAYWKPGPVRVCKKKPSTTANELAIHVEMEVPDVLFERPQLDVAITVPAIDGTQKITAEVQSAIADALIEQLGMHVHVTAKEG